MKSCFLCLTKKKKIFQKLHFGSLNKKTLHSEVICYKAMLSNKKRPTVLWEQQILPSKRSTSQK